MPNDLACFQIDDLLTDVCAVVRHPLDRADDRKQLHRSANRHNALCQRGLGTFDQLILEGINRVVEGQYALSEVRVSCVQRPDRVPDHADNTIGHHLQRVRHLGVLPLLVRLSDVDCAVGNPLKLVIDLHDGQDRPLIELTTRPMSHQRDAPTLDLDIDMVDGGVGSDHTRCGLCVVLKVRLHSRQREIGHATALRQQVAENGIEALVKVVHAAFVCVTEYRLAARAAFDPERYHLAPMPILSVNIDHVATVRQARRTIKPDPVEAAAAACLGGAKGITVHLREDRRHIQDSDVERLASALTVPLNFEMAATDAMIDIALRIGPQSAMLVPEGRAEITTEGGLDVSGDRKRLRGVVARLRADGIPASAFIDAEPEQIQAAADCGFEVCEVHTGPWAHAVERGGVGCPAAEAELRRIGTAGTLIVAAGMRFNAGHALDYPNVRPIAALGELCELHIGHAIVARSIISGMQVAVRDMVDLIEGAHA